MKKILYSLIIFIIPIIALSRPHGLRNFGTQCYINSVIQAFNALDPATAYLLTLGPNPYKRVVGERPPEAGLAYYYVEFLKQLYALPPTPPNVVKAADTLDYLGFVHEFKPNVLESTEDEGVYINIQNLQEFPFEKRDKDYITTLSHFYDTALVEFLYRTLFQSPDPLPDIAKELLAACPQADVPQFIERLINAIIEQDTRYPFPDTSRALLNHPLGKVFRIEIKKTRECPGFKGTLIEQESRLNLQTKSDDGKQTFTTLQACINNILSAHTVQFKPPGFTEDQLCTQLPRLIHLSDIVILALNRFGWDNVEKKGIKYSHKITVPLQYNFAQHLPEGYTEQTRYELIAAIEHIGRYGGGHYIAYVKQDGQWYICNDEHVFAISESDISDYSNKWGAGKLEHRGLNYAYVYFYQKTLEPPKKEPRNEEQLRHALQTLSRQLKTLEASLKA